MRHSPFLFESACISLDEIRCRSDGLTLVVHAASKSGNCPLCRRFASRVHSHYERRLADLPWFGIPVKVLWRSRRFFCDNLGCPRKIFTERFEEIAPSHARRTLRLREALCALGLFCGGEAGARLADRLGMPASGDTLLRIVRGTPPPPTATPRVLGVDDWAMCRGHRYGTILCDLERRRVVDLLPLRSAESFADWLKNHHGVEIISRDRGDFYVRGAAEGAPEAIQVTDRWHLLKNLHDALIRILDRHAQDVKAAARDVAQTTASGSGDQQQSEKSDQTPATKSGSDRLQQAQQRRESRRKKYDEVVELRRQGLSLRSIARRVGQHRSTVGRYVKAEDFPERAARTYKRGTDVFTQYLRRRWGEGCRNAKQLNGELVQRGFKGSYYMVRRRVASWRSAEGSQEGKPGRPQRMSSRCAAWILVKPSPDRTEYEQAFVASLCRCCPAIATDQRLAQQFNGMVRNHDASALDQWLDEVRATELRSFGKGLEADKKSVEAALATQWSNGQTEGQINRLKMLKRQMYGRANLDLLRIRLLSEQAAVEIAR